MKFPWSYFWFSIFLGIWWSQLTPLQLDVRFPIAVLVFWLYMNCLRWGFRRNTKKFRK